MKATLFSETGQDGLHYQAPEFYKIEGLTDIGEHFELTKAPYEMERFLADAAFQHFGHNGRVAEIRSIEITPDWEPRPAYLHNELLNMTGRWL